MKQLKKLINWFIDLFTTRYTIHISYDSEWGNADDRTFKNVRKISKQTFKELRFIDEDKKSINIKCESGLRYRIEEQ